MSNLTNPTRSQSPEFTHLTSPDPLSPPRPFFFAQDTRRSTASDSDSDKEQPPPLQPRAAYNHRRRSGVASSSTPYAPVSAGTPLSPNFSRRRNSNGPASPGIPDPFMGAEASDGGYAYSQGRDAYAPIAGAGSEDHELSPSWNPSNLYNDAEEPVSPGRAYASSRRPPPSSFQFPFQSHPGNPDPLPSRRRSSSFESLTSDQNHLGPSSQRALSDTSYDPSLPQPSAPFMSGGLANSASSSSISGMNTNSVYRGSVAAGITSPSQTALNAAYQAGQASVSMQDLRGAPAPPFAVPRPSSQAFRAPFLSPASRPGSSLWSPPSYSGGALGQGVHDASSGALALPAPPAPAPSTRLPTKLSKEEKPWMQRGAPRTRVSWWLTFSCMVIGVAGAALMCYFGVTTVVAFKDSELCSVLDENFNTLDLDNTWTREVQLGGFGNAEFQIASSFDNNSYVQGGELYIMPTLTADWLGESTVESGSVTLNPCTEALTNATACTASGNVAQDSVINPVMSARLSTKDHFSMTYGRVEVRAKLPRGDWLWPAIWMLPVNGTWPVNGEIDIMEGRGNGPEYAAQGSNFVRATVQYGPLASLVKMIYGWYGVKRTSFDKGFHTYGMEWDEKWMRFYVDTRVHSMLEITTKTSKQSFWNRASFPDTAQNGSAEVVVENPYDAINAPFDKPFYLIIDLAVGGTSGWFPDKAGNKPWFDGSLTAMFNFWQARDTWYATWPTSAADRAFRIDSVKMWKKC